MGTRTATSSIPELYAPWVEEVLGEAVPEERHATCSACAMCAPTAAKAATASLKLFDPDTKCCTYVPTLPNFLVGLILQDEDHAAAAGRDSVRRRIADGVGVTPLGLQPDPQYVLIYKHSGDQLFGRTMGLRCPHYLPSEGGQCSIWRHRNAVCATWFCKYERGQIGKRFWEALLQFLTMTERHLGLWAAGQLGEGIERLGPALLHYYVTPLSRPMFSWSQRWLDRYEEFYRETAWLVETLTWPQVREIGGPELAVVTGQLRAAHKVLKDDDVPTHLRLGAVNTVELADGQVACAGYSPNDMLHLPKLVAKALEHFDGQRPTNEIQDDLEHQVGGELGNETIRWLVDFGVLVPMAASGGLKRC